MGPAVKRDAMGQVEWFKARYVWKGLCKWKDLTSLRCLLQTVSPKQRGYCWLWGHKMSWLWGLWGHNISAQLSKKGCPDNGSAEAVSMKAEDYRGIVGSLLYITKQTSPDILATVTQLRNSLVYWRIREVCTRWLQRGFFVTWRGAKI